jgi:eukaryotic-like serine/threonine-protein kinase
VLVFDLLEGEPLAAKIARDAPLSMTETAALIAPVVSAVGTAHALGIVHRDLKPDNVFLARDRAGTLSVKVLDFGVAKITADASAHLTEADAILGTPAYMAPEQAAGEGEIDHRADVWSLGVILYECLSSIRPIEGETARKAIHRLLHAAITPVSHVAPDVPDDVADLIDRMLSRDAGKRPDDLREVLTVLGQHAPTATLHFGAPGSEAGKAADLGTRETADSGLRRFPSRRRAWWVASGLLAIGGGGVALLQAQMVDSRRQPAPSPPSVTSTPSAFATAEAHPPPEIVLAVSAPSSSSGSPPLVALAPPRRSISPALPASAGPREPPAVPAAPPPTSTRGLIEKAPF